ncbi:hypothetical protein ACHHYP_01546 [Achlya hypogyna]|uniref:RGS domain-containing protein n=1 Tax=Achlya hypogyna TaxID=1202772 RepID=A0A1V9Z8Q5_ACHHY|nr:hypothetical protein ACHHYP_01546 [Achlya hypogyna]
MQADAVPLVVALAASAYMPVALLLYLWHSSHTGIRNRHPRDTAFAAGCVMVYAVVDPLLQVLALPELPCYWHWGLGTVHVLGSVWYLILAAAHVVLYKATEVLAAPLDPDRPYPRMKFYRRLLLRSNQRRGCLLITTVSISAVLGVADGATLSASATTHACISSTMGKSVVALLSGAAVLSVYLLWLLYGVEDLCGLHRAYRHTIGVSLGVLVLLGIGALCQAQFNWSALQRYHYQSVVTTLLAHALFYFNVCQPLLSLGLARVQSLSVRMHRASAHDAQAELESFRKFLERPDGLDALQAYCRLALRLEEVLAYTTLWNFTAQVATRELAWVVFDECLDVHAPLLTPTAKRWRDYYDAQLSSPHVIELSIAPTLAGPEMLPWDFFEPFSKDLVFAMYKELLPAFQRHPLGLAWHEFRYQTVHASQRVVVRANTKSLAAILSAPLTPIPMSTNSSRFPDDD